MQVDYPSRAITIEMSELITSYIFAEQISHLNDGNTNRTMDGDKDDAQSYIDADVSCPKDVSQWLFGAVSNRHSYAARDIKTISKKMRDEPGQGFRRSGFWIAMKVFLQLGLTISLGEMHGKYVYKLIMIRFLSTMCSYLCEYTEASLNVETAIGMIAKTARRIDKLDNFTDANVYTHSMVNLTVEVQAEAIECISKVRQILNAHHKRMKDTEDIKCHLSTQKRLKFDRHVIHRLSFDLINYLEQTENTNGRVQNESPKTNCHDESQEVIFNSTVKPDVREFAKIKNDDETLHLLNYVENWVLKHLDEPDTKPPKAKYFRELANKYLAKAQNFYRNDPLGYSKMVLTMLKIIQVLYVHFGIK